MQAEARKNLGPEDIDLLDNLESQLMVAGEDSVKSQVLRELSGYWYRLNNPLLAGAYAKQIAEIEQDALSWSIAGTTFAAALTRQDLGEELRQQARDQAVEAFENAISLEPGVIEHRINQALCYIETPDTAQPMKGVQMLATLATNYPESALPAYHLARLAVKTGQMERAEERIGQALEKDSTNSKIACLAIDIYTANNKTAEAEKLKQRCAGTN